MFHRQASLALAVVIAVTRFGAAAPLLSVLTNGTCPSQGDLEAALVERRLEPGGVQYTVEVQAEPSGATLRLYGAQGQVLERRFASQDCSALAQAMAVVVEAYFADVPEPDVASSH